MLLAVLALAGCHSPLDEQPVLTGPQTAAQELVVPGDFHHGPSGFIFLRNVDEFRRESVLQYDERGLNVSGGYSNHDAACPILVTLYVYPTPILHLPSASADDLASLETEWLLQDYERAKNEILTYREGSRLVAERRVPSDGAPGIQGNFEIGRVESQLHLYIVERTWFFKLRHSYPKACASRARQALESFDKSYKEGLSTLEANAAPVPETGPMTATPWPSRGFAG